jgi:hypothetical protein
MRLTFLLLVLLSTVSSVQAGELSVLGGMIQETETHDKTVTAQLDYREGLSRYFAWSFSYLNEGHLPKHHRDGYTGQLWARADFFRQRLSLAAGIGPYLYNDTTPDPNGNFSLNNHGWAALASLAASWQTGNRWLILVRANMVESDSRVDTVSALVGIGYQLDPPASPQAMAKPPRQPAKTTGNEITFFVGETSVHNTGPAHSFAAAFEYRRGLLRHLDWTVTAIYEGENQASRRTGLATQLWAVRSFFADSLTLGVGAGPYVAVDRIREVEQGRDDDVYVYGIITMTAGYRFHEHWGVRASWNRIITDYHRDSDLWLAGLSYLF